MSYLVKFDSGHSVTFDNSPSPQDIQDVADKLGIDKPGEQTQNPAEGQSPAQGGDLFDKLAGIGNITGSIFGGNKIGQFLGEELGSRYSAGAQQLKQIDPELYQKQIGSQVTGEQLAGDIGQAGLTLGTLGVAAPETFLGRLGVNAALGAGLGSAQAMKQNASLGGIGTGAALGGVIGAGTTAAIEGVGQLFKAATQWVPEKLMTGVFKDTSDQELRSAYAIVNGEEPPPSLARQALEENMKGDPRNMLVTSLNKLKDLESDLQDIAGNETVEITNKKGYLTALKTISDAYEKNAFGTAPEELQKANELVQILKSTKGNEIPGDIALDLKRFLDASRTRSSFYLDPNLAPKQAGLKALADGVRSLIREQIPETGKLLSSEQRFINFKDAILKSAVRGQNQQLLNFSDILFSGAGHALAGPLGAGVGEAARIGLKSPTAFTNFANLLNKAGNLVPEGTSNLLERLGTLGATKLIQ